MTTPWIAAFMGLSVVVVMLGLLVLGMLRRIAPLIERSEQVLSTAERRVAVGGLPPGTTVPAFAAEQVDGAAFGANDLRGATILLFLDSDCKACEQLVADLMQDRVPDLGVPLVVVSDEHSEAQTLARSTDVTVLVDEGRSLAAAFDTGVTPQAFVLSDGTVRASGTPNNWESVSDLLASARKGGDRDRPAAAAVTS